MKTTIRKVTGTIGAALLLALALGLSSAAYAGNPPGIDADDPNHCTIRVGHWLNDIGSGGISLRSALYMANNNTKYHACGTRIKLESAVTPTTPLIIDKQGLELDGNGMSLDFSKMTGVSTDGLSGNVGTNSAGESDATVTCAIVVKQPDVVIKNLFINGASGKAGICLASSGARIMGINMTGGSSGIVFSSNAQSNKVLPNVTVNAAEEFAISDYTSGIGINQVIMTNMAFPKGEKSDTGILEQEFADNDFDPLYFSLEQLLLGMGSTGFTYDPACVTDSSAAGCAEAVVPAGTGLIGPVGLTAAEGLLKSRANIIPLVTTIEKIGQGNEYWVKGIFKQLADDAVVKIGSDGEVEPMDCSGTTAKKVDRLGVFKVTDDKYEYHGTALDNAAFGVDSEKGTFKFKLSAGDISYFTLVPVSKTWQLAGRAGGKKTVAGNRSDCIDGTAPDVGGGGNNNGGDGDLVGYASEEECNQEYEFSQPTSDEALDSDLDGIPDVLEMRIVKKDDGKWHYDSTRATCSCLNTLSCWYMTDSDHDGIPDGKDNYGLQWSDYIDVDVDTDIDSKIRNTDGNYPAGAKDLVPDVADTDSDKDGLKDGMEDRNRMFRMDDGSKVKAYLYKPSSTNFMFYPAKSDGTGMVACDLGSVENKEIGIKWGIYRAGGSGSNYISSPVEYNMFASDPAPEGTGLYILACINETVAGANNFNGAFNNDRGETDARSPDTDGDCVCDGHGMGCTQVDVMDSVLQSGSSCLLAHGSVSTRDNPLWMDDKCPLNPQPTNQCTPECIQNEILNYVADRRPDVLVQDGDGNVVQPPRFKDVNTNNIPDLFELKKEMTDPDASDSWMVPDFETVASACSDLDQDGIPDCVERWDGLCTGSVAQGQYLDPYKPDSDGDGLVDGMKIGTAMADVCPFTAMSGSQNDQFTPSGTTAYSCDPRQVYTGGQMAKILSCYLDRDDDGLRDCEEDRDMNGQVLAPVGGMDGIFVSESDPLKLDTDDDSLDDKLEVLGWPFRTNPNMADTDNDGLTDKAEDRDSNGLIEITMLEGQGCAISATKDTDPRKADSDGDTLSDKMEVAGPIVNQNIFLTTIEDESVWGQGGISHGSNPLAKDSDGDGLTDEKEYNGSVIGYYDSNPCMMDSDGDTRQDDDELRGCRLNKDFNCIGSEDGDTGSGLDADGDGLTNDVEAKLGTNPNKWDSDGDGVKDGDEDTNHNGVYEANLGETNPLVVDTDGDALNDGMELRYGTDPTNIDTDGDCISDGIEDMNLNGTFDMGTETNALSFDTDGDKLPDGWVASSGLGEDLNCNGIREQDAQGMYTETDPRNPDSDLDGESDFDEMTHGGYFNISNLDRATVGSEGCSLIGSTSGAPTSMFYLLGLLMAAAKAAASRKSKKTPA